MREVLYRHRNDGIGSLQTLRQETKDVKAGTEGQENDAGIKALEVLIRSKDG